MMKFEAVRGNIVLDVLFVLDMSLIRVSCIVYNTDVFCSFI